jgi:hypothetical protein
VREDTAETQRAWQGLESYGSAWEELFQAYHMNGENPAKAEGIHLRMIIRLADTMR